MSLEAVAAFRRRVRFNRFRGRVLRVEASQAAPTRPSLVVLAPEEAPELEAWAEVPPWLSLAGTGLGIAREVLAAAIAGDHDELGPLFDLRLSRREVRNAVSAGRISVELLAPGETRVLLPDGRSVRHLSYVNARRRHAKAFKHVLGLGREVDAFKAGGCRQPLTSITGQAPVQPDLLALQRLGCGLIERVHALTEEEDFFHGACASCPDRVLHQADEGLRSASAILRGAAAQAMSMEPAPAVAHFPHGYRGDPREGYGVADDRGVLHFTRSARGCPSDHQEAVTTYLAATQRTNNPTSDERRSAAVRALDVTVRKSRLAAFIDRRDA